MEAFWIKFLTYLTIAAIVAFNIFLVRIAIIIIRYRTWRKFSIPAVGTVGELTDINDIRNRRNTITSYRYNYAFQIICGDQAFDSIYSEVCKPDTLPLTHPGKKINILWSDRDQKYLPYCTTKKEIWQLIKQEFYSSLTIALRVLGKNHSR